MLSRVQYEPFGVENAMIKSQWGPFSGGHGVIVLLLSALSLASSAVRAETFAGPMAGAQWRLSSSVFECRLSHEIPRFGAAVFSRRAGEEQRFYLQQDNRHLAGGEARVHAEHPLWRENAMPRSLGRFEVSEEPTAVSLNWQQSQRLAAELGEGMRLVFTREPWHGREQPVQVVLEPVGFRPGIDGFHECLVDLLPVNFDQVSRTALYFPQGGEELPREEQEKLDQVALYANADERISAFYIDGHTDGAGLRADNLELSRERAERVAQYLVDRGVPRDKITVRWHGERYPVASNREPEGRSENRRVTIRLERPDDRLSSR